MRQTHGTTSRGIAWAVHGSGTPAVFLTAPWAVIHSGMWKAQVPYLARHHRVITADPLGNGRSRRSADPAEHTVDALVGDLIDVLDATGTQRAVLVGHCTAAFRALMAAGRHPDRVLGVVLLDPNVKALAPELPARAVHSRTEPLDTDEGWAKDNHHYWRRDYRGFLEFFFAELVTEPHMHKVVEDCVAWGLQTTPEVLIATQLAGGPAASVEEVHAVVAAVTCPALVINSRDDRCIPPERGRALADLLGADLLELPDAGHLAMATRPVVVNRALHAFASRFAPAPPPRRRWRGPRALMVSSPIGLGHTRRDLAIARELRALHPGLTIDWLAQPPVDVVVAAAGERVHPASRHLAAESVHIEAEAGEHDVRVFEALRRMDAVLVANFHVFDDVLDEGYDLVVADEGWEVDHFWHENPDRKRSAYAWLTDFVGWLPMPAGGDREALLTADLNARTLDHVARLPHVRDRAVFIGEPVDVLDAPFGPGMPSIREWTREHYAFSGYVTGFVPPADREELRAELGYRADEQICLVTAGGSGVGAHLLRRVAAAHPQIRRAVPGLRMIVVTGPRTDPAAIGAPPGVEVRGFVPDLHRHLAACDVAVVQGGLATTMELTAAGRPFVYVPLGNHFEQQIHVRHRLQRHRAGRCVRYPDATPDRLADAITAELARTPDYLPVPTDGARRAAELIAELL